VVAVDACLHVVDSVEVCGGVNNDTNGVNGCVALVYKLGH
jgi:hypothetical protein